MNAEELRSLLQNKNVAAFLRVIREGESTQAEDAYTLLNGGAHFGSFADHPYAGQRAPPGLAAGAYQYIPSTWQRVAQQIGAPDFSPPWQDVGAVALIAGRGALEAVLAGNLGAAMAALRDEWVSLPALGLTRATRVFERFGGTLGAAVPTQPAAPIEERPTEGGEVTMGVAIPLLLQLVPQVLQLFSGRAQTQIQKATGADPAMAAQFMQNLIDRIGQVAQVPVVDNLTAVQAVAAVTALPAAEKAAAIAELERESLDYIDKLAPLLDKIAAQEKALWAARDESADRAAMRGRMDKVDIAPNLVKQADRSFVGLAVLIVLLLGLQMYFDEQHKPDPTLTGFLGLFAYGVIRMMDRPSAYRFGGAFESTAIDATKTVVTQTIEDRRKSPRA